MLVIFLFIDALLGLFIILKYNIALPVSYLFTFILIYFLLFISFKYNLTRIYPVLAIFYGVSIVSVFAFRFGLFHGDSVFDLASAQYIVRHGFVETAQHYTSAMFPILHIFTVTLGYVIGEDSVINLYNVAVWIPTLATIVSILFIYLTIKKITEDDKSAFLASIIWISLPFVSRWMIQFTRTTIAIPFLIILGYLLVKTYQDKTTLPLSLLMIVAILTVILAHPVVAFFGVLSLIFICIYEIIRTSVGSMVGKIIDSAKYNTKRIDTFVLVSLTTLIAYWTYNAYMLNPLVNTMSQFIQSFQTFFLNSILGEIITGSAKNSLALAGAELKIFGLGRTVLFIFISLIGTLFLSSDKKFKSIVIPLSIFAAVYMVLNYGMSLSATTYYRAAVYSSLWFIIAVGYFIYKINNKNKFWKTVVYIPLIAILILPAPFFTGEVVLPSDWLYNPQPSKCIDYERGECQRFTEHYHRDVAIWINRCTKDNSLIWSDGTHSYAFIVGYGNRSASYTGSGVSKPVMRGIDIDKLKSLNIDYVVVNDLMRKVLIVPYGGCYSHYDYGQLDTSFNSNIVYDSGDANIYKIL